MRLLLAVIAAVAVTVLSACVCAAQRGDTASVVATTLAATITGLQMDGDALLDSPVAFDPRPVRPGRGRAPTAWLDSVMPTWNGNVRGAAFTTTLVDAVLREVNGTPQWVTCGAGPDSRPCTSIEFPAVFAVSEPWISGDQAQVLVYVRYRSDIEIHPHAWFANVVWLQRASGRWTVHRMYNYAGT